MTSQNFREVMCKRGVDFYYADIPTCRCHECKNMLPCFQKTKLPLPRDSQKQRSWANLGDGIGFVYDNNFAHNRFAGDQSRKKWLCNSIALM